MKPVQVLTLCLGVSDYSLAVLEAGEEPLKYLAQGARALSNCLRRGWPDAAARHHAITDGDATLDRVRTLLGSESFSYDLFILYLGGHGRAVDGEFRFLFSGDQKEQCVATSHDIDALLALVNSKCTLLLLDACFAGQYGRQTQFFGSSDPAVTAGQRTCLTSSKRDQKSWEDPKFQRSLFVDALIRALTNDGDDGEKAGRTIQSLYVDTAADVTRHAFALKRSATQEPDIFGSRRPVFELPVIRQPSLARSMTTYEILRLRVRQILVGLIAATMLTVAVISGVTWRPAFNASGYIELRPGPKWLSGLNFGRWATRVETDVTEKDIKQQEERPWLKNRLLNEAGIYPWPGVNDAGVRRWVDPFLADFLSDSVAARWRIQLGFAGASESLLTTVAPGGGGGLRVPVVQRVRVATLSTSTELAAEARMLSPSLDIGDIWKTQWASKVVDSSCNDDHPLQTVIDRMDLYLASDPLDFASWLRSLESTVRADPGAVGVAEVGALVRMLTVANRVWRREYAASLGAPGEPLTGARIAARFTERPSQGELAALANLAVAVAEQQALTGAVRTALVEVAASCEDVGMRVLPAWGKDGDPAKVIEWAHGRSRSDQGRTALRLLAERGALPSAEVHWVAESLGFFGDAVTRRSAFVNVREWLSAIAGSNGLPADIVNVLLAYATDRMTEGHADDTRQALAILARAPGSLSTVEKTRVDELLERLISAAAPMPMSRANIEILGALSRGGIRLRPELERALRGPIEGPEPWQPPEVVFTDDDRSASRTATMLAAGLTSTELLAFAGWIIGQAHDTHLGGAARADRFLSQALRDGLRFGVPEKRLADVALAAAIARQAAGLSPGQPAEVRGRVRCCSTDVAGRLSEIAVAQAALSRLPTEGRLECLGVLRNYWRREREPEVKLGLAEIIVRAMEPQG